MDKSTIENIKKENLSKDKKITLEVIMGSDCKLPYIGLGLSLKNATDLERITICIKFLNSLASVKEEIFSLFDDNFRELYEKISKDTRYKTYEYEQE